MYDLIRRAREGKSIPGCVGDGIVYSFAADRRRGFNDDDTALLQATLPGLSLAMKVPT
jgi:hypothetical protein